MLSGEAFLDGRNQDEAAETAWHHAIGSHGSLGITDKFFAAKSSLSYEELSWHCHKLNKNPADCPPVILRFMGGYPRLLTGYPRSLEQLYDCEKLRLRF